jgi:hypothetical protein
MAHKGKVTSDVNYNPDDRPEAYSNPAVYSRLSEYTAMAQEVHGSDYDPTTRTLTEMSSCGSEEARGMDDTGLSTWQSTRRPLQLRLKCEQGARARAQPYDLSRIAHIIAYSNSRLMIL